MLDLFMALQVDLVVLVEVGGVALETLYFTICEWINLRLLYRISRLYIEILLSNHKRYKSFTLRSKPRRYRVISSAPLPLFE